MNDEIPMCKLELILSFCLVLIYYLDGDSLNCLGVRDD